MSNEKTIEERIRHMLYMNLKAGLSPYLNTKYCYVMPSPMNYPFQWWWDTCFNVFILCTLGEKELAKRNLSSLFAMQEENGFVGHMIYWESLFPRNLWNFLQGPPKFYRIRPHMSSLIQPPLVGQALLKIFRLTQDKEFLEEMLPEIKKYYVWLMANRDFDGDGLISIISPFESGTDWSPSFDQIHRLPPGLGSEKLFRKVILCDLKNFLRGYNLRRIYKHSHFLVKSALVNTMYVLDLHALSELCKISGDTEGALFYEKAAGKATGRMLELMYNKEKAAFFDLHGKENRQLQVLTFTIALPLLLEDIPQEIAKEIIERHFLNENEFALPFGIPSVAKSEPSFSPDESKFLWRGPVWIPINWWMQKIFLKYGCIEEAGRLARVTLEMFDKYGCREYYNPLTGEGYGAKEFSWGGLITDMKTS